MKKDKKFCLNHPEKQVKCKGLCRNCYEKQLIKNNPSYKIKQQENSKNWHAKNKKHKAEYDKKYRQINPQNKDDKYFKTIKREYNCSKEQYNEFFKISGNKCMICSKMPYKGKRLHLDHNHITHEPRGLLCTRCNWYLHTIENDNQVLEKIKKYLKL
jgi:hypothetical protein